MSVCSRLCQSGRWPVAAALLVFALQAGLGSTAQASCGDWLAHDGSSASEHPSSGEHRADGVPSPCSRGECRRAPDQPLPGSPFRSFTPQTDQWGTLADFALELKSVRDRFAPDVPLHFPDGQRVPLERPPRA